MGTSGTVYYKHFNANEHVEIPAVDPNASDLRQNVLVVWDELSDETEIYDILANGKSVNFDKEKYEYSVNCAGMEQPPTISVSATPNAAAEVVQASSMEETALVRACGKEYKIVFSKGDTEPGKLTEVKMAGESTYEVYGIPSIGAKNLNLYDEYFDSDGAFKEKYKGYDFNKLYTDMSNPEINPDSDRSFLCIAFNDRKISTTSDAWRKVNDVYGDQYRFAVKGQQTSKFVSDNVTRLFKPSRDPQDEPEKAYEFKINKGASVYITVKSKSDYIEGLNKGWKFETLDEKDKVMFAGYNQVTIDGQKINIPNGQQVLGPSGLSHGYTYVKHFEAGETVEIPVHNTNDSYYDTCVYVIWDNLNSESDIYSISVNGQKIDDFSKDIYSYTVEVEKSEVIPSVSASAAAGANLQITQATDITGCAEIFAGGKNYKIRFVEIVPDMELSAIEVDGNGIAGFDAEVKEYDYTIDRGDMHIPTVSATAKDPEKIVEIRQAQKVPGEARINIISASGYTVTYKIYLRKTGEPGTVTELNSAKGDKIYAVKSLGVEPVQLYEQYSTDAERIAAVLSKNNPYYYENGEYAIYTNRSSGTAWNYSNENNVYGAHSEFTIIDNPSSVLISPDVTRIYKPSSDAAGSTKAYSFKISKGATVYITTMARSAYLDSFNDWKYEFDEKYKIYHSGYILAKDASNEKSYRILSGYPQMMQCAMGGAYKKHFNKNETVEIPSFSLQSVDKAMGIFIVWDECNDDAEIYGLNYWIGAEEYNIADYNEDKNEYYVSVPQSVSTVPVVDLNATGAVKYSVDNPSQFDSDGRATVLFTIGESSEKRKISVVFIKEAEESRNALLDSVSFDGIKFDGFNTCIKEYMVDIQASMNYPNVAAVVKVNGAKIEVIQPSTENNGVCTIKSTSNDGNAVEIYTIRFNRLDYNINDAQVMKIKDNKKAIVTIVHDDGTLDTVDYMNAELEKNGLKSTIAMIGSYVNEDNRDVWQSYLDTGRFNIANHSYNHRYWGQSDAAEAGVRSDGGKFDNPEGTMTYEIVESGKHLREMFPKESVLCFVKPGFTYPSGKAQVSEEAYRMISDNYICMRNTGGGLESIPVGDWLNVKSYQVSPQDTALTWMNLIDESINQNGWIVYLFHQIKDVGGGITVEKNKATEFFEYAGEKVKNGDVWCAFLDEATLYLQEYDAIKSVDAYYYPQDEKMVVRISDTLDDNIYNYPLTVKIEVPDGWEKAMLIQNSREEYSDVFAENEKNYIYVNVIPNGENAEVIKAE